MKLQYSILATILAFNTTSYSANLLVNGGFETQTPVVPAGGNANRGQANVPGWSTTAPNGAIEFWGDGFRGINTANGTVADVTDGESYFAEINATQAATLFQDVQITEVVSVDYRFLHRARGYNDPSDPVNFPLERRDDVMTFRITDLGADGISDASDNVLFERTVTTDNISDPGEFNGWVLYSGEDAITTVADNFYRFSYEAVSSGAGSSTRGNFIDNAAFGVGVFAVPEPSSAVLSGLAGMMLLIRRKR